MLKLGTILLIVLVLYVEANNPQHTKRNSKQRNAVHRTQNHATNKSAQSHANRSHAAHKPARSHAAHRPAQSHAAHRPGSKSAAARKASKNPRNKNAAHKPAAHKNRRSPAKGKGAQAKNKKNRNQGAKRQPAKSSKGTGGLKLKIRPRKRADGDTTTTKCNDRATNCKDFVQFCTVDGYSGILKTYCNMGCGHCAPDGANCRDKYSTCAQWNRKGFCDASFLTIQSKRSMCPKTCNLCGTSSREPNCNAAKDKYNAKCLPTTCAKAEEKKVQQCVTYCAAAQNKDKAECKDATTQTTTTTQTPPAGGCAVAANKYTDACLPETCKTDAEKDKTECEKFCGVGGKGEKQQVCLCTEAANKYKQWCGEQTCKDTEEKKKEKGCNEFCKKTGNDKKEVCDCEKEPNKKDAFWCKAAGQCDAADKYGDDCISTTCDKESEKKIPAAENKCKAWCEKSEENRKKDFCNCENAKNKNIATWCGGTPAETNCDDALDLATYYGPNCFKTVCAKPNEKTYWGIDGTGVGSCYTACTDATNKNDPICKCEGALQDGKASWCQKPPVPPACTPDKNTNDCMKERCKELGQKYEKNCMTYCSDTGGGKDEAVTCKSGDDNKFNSQNAKTTCVAADEKTKIKGPCYYHCKMTVNKGENHCDCSKTENAQADWCLEDKCKAQTKANIITECTPWCAKDENKKRKGCNIA